MGIYTFPISLRVKYAPWSNFDFVLFVYGFYMMSCFSLVTTCQVVFGWIRKWNMLYHPFPAVGSSQDQITVSCSFGVS